MVGKPQGSGAANILPKVKEVINEFLEDIQPPASVHILPFDEGVHDDKAFPLNSNHEIVPIKEYVEKLDAKGSNTWIFRSLTAIFDSIQSVQHVNSNEEHISIIYLYTDGLDNDLNTLYTTKSTLEQFNAKRGKYDWLFYISLGQTLVGTKMGGFVGAPNTTIITPESGTVPSIVLISNKISILPFGNLWETGIGKMTALFTVNGRKHMLSDTTIHVEAEGQELPEGTGLDIKPLNFEPVQAIELSMKLTNFKKTQKNCIGNYQAVFKLSTSSSMVYVIPDEIKVKFEYTPPPPTPIWIICLIAIVILLILYCLGILVYCLLTGNTLSLWPWASSQASGIFSLSFETLEPIANKGELLDLSEKLSRKKAIKIGQGSEFFSSATESFSLIITKVEGRDTVKISSNNGTVFLIKQAEKQEQEIINEPVLRWGCNSFWKLQS